MIEIIPAIMPDNYEDLVQKASRIKGVVSCAQIDVMDSKFVPSISWPYDDNGIKEFASMVKNDEMLPFWEELSYEVDLMVEHPESVIADWIAVGVSRIIVHLESTDKLREIIEIIEEVLAKEVDFTGMSPVELGVALGAETSIEQITPYANDIDVIQFMGIRKIGYQGEPFDENTIERVRDLRQKYPHLIISIDGGVNFETAPRLIKAGVSRLVSGSTIFKSADIQETILKLKQG